MNRELELKAVVSDPAQCRSRLLEAGAQAGYAGRLTDLRFDKAGELTSRDQVLRVRTYVDERPPRARISWKGPTQLHQGYKARDEIEFESPGPGASDLFRALGYDVIDVIDRMVEYYRIDRAVVRFEWYPRMDVLVEVEGAPDSIEQAVRRLGIARSDFTAEPLTAFLIRYHARTSLPPITRLTELGQDRPSWDSR